MKTKTLKKLFSVLLSVIIISCFILYIYIQRKNKVNEKNLLQVANSIINEAVVTGIEENCIEEETFSVDKISSNGDILGKILIPKINVEAPIKEGTTAETLKEAVGHFSNTKYWNGNIGLASHNRGTYAHYFENINQLNNGDEIIYQTKLGTRVYAVESVTEISEEDFSVLNNTNKNYITLITCIKNKQNMRLCVKAVERSIYE